MSETSCEVVSEPSVDGSVSEDLYDSEEETPNQLEFEKICMEAYNKVLVKENNNLKIELVRYKTVAFTLTALYLAYSIYFMGSSKATYLKI
jgi:hypothetical protein